MQYTALYLIPFLKNVDQITYFCCFSFERGRHEFFYRPFYQEIIIVLCKIPTSINIIDIKLLLNILIITEKSIYENRVNRTSEFARIL